MNVALKKLLESLLTKQYSLTDEELQGLLYEKLEGSEDLKLKDDSLDVLLNRDSERVKRIKQAAEDALKPEFEVRFNNGFKKAKGETMKDFEDRLRTEFGIDTIDKQGVDLVKSIIAAKSKVGDQITIDEIKKHPDFLKIENDWKTRYETDTNELKTKHEQFIADITNREKYNRVDEDVLKIFAELKPVEPENTIVAHNRRKDFLNKFRAYNFELKEDGNHLVLDKDGKRIEDAQLNAVNFKSFVKEMTGNYYEFKVQDGKGAPGNPGGGGGGSVSFTKPTTQEEYAKLLSQYTNEGKTQERLALFAYWRLNKPK